MDLGPVPLNLKVPEDRKAHDVAMLRRAMRTTSTPRRWPVRTTVVVVGALVVVGGGAAAVAAVWHSPRAATDDVSARCYTSASTNFGDDFPGTSIATAADSTGHVTGTISQSVVDDCAAAWRAGILVAGVATAQRGDDATEHPVPALAACVLPSGEAAVFPGPADTCQHLNLSPLRIVGK